ncbi:hypothetical protein BsWGS_21396 [Bradybaena similaris]
MAGVFGDLDLFSEFEKHREAQGSFIHYDEETVRSRIVFEDYAEDDDSESEDEWRNEEIQEASSTYDAENRKVQNRNRTGVKDHKVKTESGVGDYGDRAEQPKFDVKKDVSVGVSSTNGDQPLSEEEAADRNAWLSEQLYAEAAEEANRIGTSSTQQLVYEKNKYRRYAKILDSTRYVPDEDSPSVQLIFNNNSFARKYRQQIEQFIKSLLWEELNSNSHDTASEIIVKPGAPTCVDINSGLPPEKRGERMRQRHAIIGNSQFHKQFLIDFLGWPFTVSEPTRCNVNWEIPLYGQVFNEVYADPSSKSSKKPGKQKQKPACWNCNEENHAVSECKQPRNPAKIAANRREFLAQQQQNQGGFEPKFTGPSRYHLDPDLASAFTKFKPGVISEALRQALGLTQDQLPQHVYKMRLYGYPPGWLAEARQIQSGVTIFDKNGRVTLITGECLEDGELQEEDAVEAKAEYDVGKIIEYPGFTIPVPLGFVDEHSVYMMPPIQQHQLKKTLMTQNTDKSSCRKRKRGKKQDQHKVAKKAKAEESKAEDGEIEDGAEENGMAVEKEKNSEEATEDSNVEAAETSPPTQFLEEKFFPRSSSTISLSRDFGTPVLTRENSGLPDAAKFGQGVEEHIPFENLPNSTGTFEKMRSLIEAIRNKTKK